MYGLIQQDGIGDATVDSMARDLALIGVGPGQVLLVHSSLSSIGWVRGGSLSVIHALDSVLGENGTLVMPTHTSQLGDPALRRSPAVSRERVDAVRQALPVFDPGVTPTSGMGAIPESFRCQPAVLRSNHPHDSFAARGPKAHEIVAIHSLQNGLGEASPLAALYKLDARVLLLGVGHESSTSLHLAENRANYAGKQTVRNGGPVQIDNQRQWLAFEHLCYRQEDFNRIGRDYAEQTRETSYGYIGRGQSMLMPMRGLIDYAVRWMERNR